MKSIRVGGTYDGLELFGRVLLASIFIAAGLGKIPAWSSNLQYMQSVGMPASPLLLGAAAFVEVVFGITLLLGFKTRFSAAVIALYLIPTTLIFHAFWGLEGMERQTQMVNFLKNVSIIGGLLVECAHGAGRLSIDGRRRNRQEAVLADRVEIRRSA